MTWDREPPDDLDVIGGAERRRPGLPTWSWLSRLAALLRDASERRRGWIAAGSAALAIAAGAAVVLSLSTPVPRPDAPVKPVPSRGASFFVITTAIARSVGPDGVFAWGTSGARPWQLAVQDIADPGSPCRPGVTVNGSDAEPLLTGQRLPTPIGSPAFVTLGPAMPGTGFAVIQVAAGVSLVWPDATDSPQLPSPMRPVAVTECGATFHLVGFAYGLAIRLRLHTGTATWQAQPSDSDPAATLTIPQVDGIWQNVSTSRAPAESGRIGAGTILGQGWTMRVTSGLAGDCFGLDTGVLSDSAQQGTSERTYCAPVSTPSGLDAIIAFPDPGGQGYIYAVSVSAATARIRLALAGGRTASMGVQVVGGRKYAAFAVTAPARLVRLTLLDPAGQMICAVEMLPGAGFLQFQP